MKMMMGILTIVLLMNLFSVLANAGTVQSARAPVCKLASEGLVVKSWAKHRIMIGDETVYGANDMASIAEKLQTLRHEGLCR